MRESCGPTSRVLETDFEGLMEPWLVGIDPESSAILSASSLGAVVGDAVGVTGIELDLADVVWRSSCPCLENSFRCIIMSLALPEAVTPLTSILMGHLDLIDFIDRSGCGHSV